MGVNGNRLHKHCTHRPAKAALTARLVFIDPLSLTNRLERAWPKRTPLAARALPRHSVRSHFAEQATGPEIRCPKQRSHAPPPFAHLRNAGLAKGDPIPLPLTMAAIFHAPGDATGFNQYGRFSNPTWDAVEHMLAHLEDAPCVAFPSGMAAISAVFFSLLKSGDRILLPSDGYHTTRGIGRTLPEAVSASHFDTRPTSTFLDGGFDGYRLVFVETPSNPGLDICDIAAVAEAAHAAGALAGRRQHDHDALRPASARSRRRHRRRRRHQGAERPFRRAVRPCRQPQSRNHRRGAGLAQDCGAHSRPVRGLAGASRTGNARRPLRPHVHHRPK